MEAEKVSASLKATPKYKPVLDIKYIKGYPQIVSSITFTKGRNSQDILYN